MQSVPTLSQSLLDASRRFTDKLAYAEGRRRVSWQDLAQRVEDVAAGLVALGVEPGDRLAICAENSIDWITAYLATLRAGGAGVLVYYDLKQREILEQVTRPDSRVLFASSQVIEKLEGGIEGVERVVLLDGTRDGLLNLDGVVAAATDESRDVLASRMPGPESLAAIVYTSGTTGGAKGVMLSHRNLVSNGLAAIEALNITGEDSSLLVLPMHHAMPLLACVVLPPLIGAHFVIENDLRRIRDRLQEFSPTIFFGVPALYELMYRNVLARAEAEGRLKTMQRALAVTGAIKRFTGLNLAPVAFKRVHAALGGRLRFLISGGAALNPRTVHDFAGLGMPLLQGWGMTEASPVIAVQRFEPKKFRFGRFYDRQAGSVGPALPGVEVRLVDVPEKGIRVAETGEGEVQVRGPNVFMGYWQAPEVTEAALDGGWLRTGDMGRIDAEGNIYLTGRSKYVIVLESGEKVHPDELEALLSESELLQDICILGRESEDGRGRTLVTALVYPNPEAARAGEPNLNAETLQRLVSREIESRCRQVAAYKRVTRIELTHEPLPKTALQKVARGTLAPRYDFDFDTWLASAEPDE